MYDVFKNLKQSADEMALREASTGQQGSNRGFLKRVADYYCGGKDTASNLTRQLAGIAVSFSWKLVEIMGAILNKEEPDQAARLDSEDGEGKSVYRDARIYKDLITKSTFHGATTFKTQASEADQINVLRRCAFCAPQRNYKPISKQEIEYQTKKAIAARKEVEKMSVKLQGHRWPEDMEAVKQTLLTKKTLDDEVEQNQDCDELLPVSRTLWERLFPLAVQHEKANANLVKDSEKKVDDAKSSKVNDNVSSAVSATAHSSNEKNPTAEAECLNDDEREIETGATGDGLNDEMSHIADDEKDQEEDEPELSPIAQLHVPAENKDWREFQLTLQREELFDFIYADPQQSLSASELKQGTWAEFKDEKRMKEFANFCRISLRPGCYVFLFVIAEEFSSWVSAFQTEGMKVMKVMKVVKAPFLVGPSAESARLTRLKDLPQPCGDLAIVARTPGNRSSPTANFTGPYACIDRSFTRKLGIIDNVLRCTNPLRAANSRTEVRPRERHVDLVSEIIETFCSPTGTVLDVFGGALSSAISCISSHRPCMVLEKDTYCFGLAVKCLEKLCRDRLLNPAESEHNSTELSDVKALANE